MRRINAFQAYEKYLAVRNHFKKDSYNYKKYNGKVNVSSKHFITRQDKWMFEKLAKLYEENDYLDLLVSNFSKNEDCYVLDLLDENSKINYYEWKKKKDSLIYYFDQELANVENYLLKNNLKMIDLFKVSNSTHPLIYKLYCSKELSIEFICILDVIISFLEKQKKLYESDIILKKFARLIKKLQIFLVEPENQHKYKALLLKKLKEMIDKTS